MKKHITKKCSFEVKVSENFVDEVKEIEPQPGDVLEIKDLPPEFNAFSVNEDDNMIICFQYNDSGHVVFIPEPDPVLIYFDSAYSHYKTILEKRKVLLQHFKGVKTSENYMIDLYSFFGAVNAFIILLFTSIEAFINREIPENYKYTVEGDRKTETYNKDQIQKNVSFKDKIGPVLQGIFGKDIKTANPDIHQSIINLKELRDGIVHLKPETGNNAPYSYLYKKALDFRYEKTIDAVMEFLNFYKPNYVTYCGCQNDF